MKRPSLLLLLGGVMGGLVAQESTIPHSNSGLQPSPIASTPVFFKTATDIASCTLPEAPIQWGMDVAWNDKTNVWRGTNYIGKEILSVGRVSFQPSDLVDAEGNLSATQKSTLQTRLNNISLSGVKDIILNCDHEVLCNKDSYPKCDTYYANYYGKTEEWYKVIKASVKYCQEKGYNVIAIAPFNEPDYTDWKEGTKAHFKAIAKLISEDPDLAGIRICAGNTLNCDQAAGWYSYMKPYVQEGNTHQLAGSFDNYASFWQTVRNDGNHATADELHNTMEAFVGIHYGMQTGIWWGYDGICRGEFCKASFYGKEIGYGENRSAWTAGAVYKRPDGRIDAFVGSSERQANTSTFELTATDHPAYFDGVGPMNNYSIEIPGGTAYQKGQTNAEHMVQIHYGEDVPVEPLIAGNRYIITNKNSGFALGFQGGSSSGDITLAQYSYKSGTSPDHVHWLYRPISTRSGGDFGYFVLRNERDTLIVADIKDWSLEDGASIIGYRQQGTPGANEQWAIEYAGEGYYYIRSRQSGLYLDVKGSSTKNNVVVLQANYSGKESQKWKFIPTDAPQDNVAPKAPTGLKVELKPCATLLTWDANTEADVLGYNVVRCQVIDGKEQQWDVIGRKIEGTTFLDNSRISGADYLYKLKAIDNSRNLSSYSEAVRTEGEQMTGLVAHYNFESGISDVSGNQNHAVGNNYELSDLMPKEGKNCLSLSGSKSFVQLPASVGNMRTMTFSTWVNLLKTQTWARIFDFGNGTNQYMFLTPNNGSEMRFVIKDNGDEQILATTKLTSGWKHLAVTIGEDGISLYLNGALVASTDKITLRPSDIHPVMNYIGRSQFAADPWLAGELDDFRIYNFALSADEVKALYNGEEVNSISEVEEQAIEERIYSLDGRQQSKLTKEMQIIRTGQGTIKRMIK